MSGRVDDALTVLREAMELGRRIAVAPEPNLWNRSLDAVDVLAGALSERDRRLEESARELEIANDNLPRVQAHLQHAIAERDALAAEVERLRTHWQEIEHPFDKSEYDAMYEREQAAVASRDVLAVQVEQLREALGHYANEDNWDETSPPESVNTAGYLLFEYAGGHDLPWHIARAALEAGEKSGWATRELKNIDRDIELLPKMVRRQAGSTTPAPSAGNEQ